MNAESFATFGRFTPPAAGGGGGGDTTPPTITITSYPTTPDEPFVLEVVDAAPGLAYLGIFASLPGDGGERVVYRRDAFKLPFTGSLVGDEVTVYMAGGWPYGTTMFTVDAIDGDGNDEGAP